MRLDTVWAILSFSLTSVNMLGLSVIIIVSLIIALRRNDACYEIQILSTLYSIDISIARIVTVGLFDYRNFKSVYVALSYKISYSYLEWCNSHRCLTES
jgi:hypothetical protein